MGPLHNIMREEEEEEEPGSDLHLPASGTTSFLLITSHLSSHHSKSRASSLSF